MKILNKSVSVLAALTIFASIVPSVYAQKHRHHHLQQMTTIQGKVVKFEVNHDYVYNGFYLNTGSESILVKFPPHMGSQIVGAVKTNSDVTVNGVLDYSPFGDRELRMESLTANGKIIYNYPPSHPPVPPVENFVSNSGKVISQQVDRKGRLIGLIVDNNTILRIPRHVGYQLGNMLQNGTNVTYTGLQKQPKDGEVKSANYTIVHCRTININGQEYFLGGPGKPKRR